MPFVVVALALAGIIWLLFMGTQALGRVLFSANEQYIIRHMDIESDGKQVTPRRLKDWANLREGMNLFEVNLDNIRLRLETMVPIIKQATIRRQLPDTLVIRVIERQALARLASSKNQMPLAIDAEGYVLGPTSVAPTLPIIEGCQISGLRPGGFVDSADMRRALDLLTLCDTSLVGQHLRIHSVNIAHPDHLDIMLDNGTTRVLLAGADTPNRLRKVAATFQTALRQGLVPVVIDATGNNNFPVEYR